MNLFSQKDFFKKVCIFKHWNFKPFYDYLHNINSSSLFYKTSRNSSPAIVHMAVQFNREWFFLHVNGQYYIQTGNIKLKGDVFTVLNLDKVSLISWKKECNANETFLNHSRNPT